MRTIEENRKLYLDALRSGKYKKGTTYSDDKGNPLFNNNFKDGYCACAIMYELFYDDRKGRSPNLSYRIALEITAKQCRYIQQELNDRLDLSFPEIANIIESKMWII